ncbi:hypothetical protein F5148DRAFT_1213109 [Russula earlei]|uniref:Uncharacterized protein n=1 Tax=Russula earlei TaxID=71964 RepID=A0ACC0U4N5_9AGAM|nr:hypothetical protein F5148DRAFT_1213109 [Russula earlei]
MTYPSYAFTTALSTTGSAPCITSRNPPDILTYCFATRMVYVTPGETYDQAIDIAQESFPELNDVERSRIGLEVRVVLSNQGERKAAEIGRSAWSAVIRTLAQFEIVEIRVAPSTKPARAISSAGSSVSGPPPYSDETGWGPDMKVSATNLAQASPNSQSYSQPHTLTNRFVGLLCGSSRGRHSA